MLSIASRLASMAFPTGERRISGHTLASCRELCADAFVDPDAERIGDVQHRDARPLQRVDAKSARNAPSTSSGGERGNRCSRASRSSREVAVGTITGTPAALVDRRREQRALAAGVPDDGDHSRIRREALCLTGLAAFRIRGGYDLPRHDRQLAAPHVLSNMLRATSTKARA
jgi:hypothetical protein